MNLPQNFKLPNIRIQRPKRILHSLLKDQNRKIIDEYFLYKKKWVHAYIEKFLSTHRLRLYRDAFRLVSRMKKDGIWDILPSPYVVGYIRKLARLYGLPHSTLEDWRTNLIDDPHYIPLHIKDPNTGNVFNLVQQDRLKTLVKAVCQNLRYPMTNALFRKISTTYYHSIPEDEHPQPNLKFNCSDAFIRKFKRRVHLSTRKAHIKRRNNFSLNDVTQFRNYANEIFQKVSYDHIANCDETFWHLIYVSNQTWAPTNSDGITIDLDVNEKKKVLQHNGKATILRNGKTLPLVHIAVGGTTVAEGHWF